MNLVKLKKLYAEMMPLDEMAITMKVSNRSLSMTVGTLIRNGTLKKRDLIEVKNKGARVTPKLTEPEWKYKPLGAGISIMELTHDTCCFPCEGGVFCGAKVHKKRMCFEHHRVCWGPPPPRKESSIVYVRTGSR